MEVYLPWPSYNEGHKQAVHVTREVMIESIKIVDKVHPNIRGLTTGALSMHVRNVQIVLGRNLDEPVKFLLYWNPIGKTSGGTIIAVGIAKLYKIPTFNMASKQEFDEFVKYIKEEEEKCQ